MERPATVHELSIMENALALVLTQAQVSGATRVHSISLRIGALSGVVPEALDFAFQALAPGTAAAEARLSIERVPARFWCRTCLREFEAGDLFAECPGCHTASCELRAGREMDVVSMEIE